MIAETQKKIEMHVVDIYRRETSNLRRTGYLYSILFFSARGGCSE